MLTYNHGPAPSTVFFLQHLNQKGSVSLNHCRLTPFSLTANPNNKHYLTPITAWMSGVFASSSSLAACTSAPCASASAMSGRLCRRADRWRSAPGWNSLGSSGSEDTSCSISTSPLEDSSDSSSEGGKQNILNFYNSMKKCSIVLTWGWYQCTLCLRPLHDSCQCTMLLYKIKNKIDLDKP